MLKKLTFLTIFSFVSLQAFSVISDQKMANAMTASQIVETRECWKGWLKEYTYSSKYITLEAMPDSRAELRHYLLVIAGLEVGTEFGLYTLCPCDFTPPQYLTSGYISETGEAFYVTGAPLNSIKFTTSGKPYPGEPTFFLLITKDEQTCIAARVMLNPIENTGKENRYIWSEMANEHLYVIQGRNFKPNEEIIVSAIVDSKVEESQHIRASLKGHFAVPCKITDPHPLGKCEVQVTADGQSEPIKLQWGLSNRGS